LRPATGGQSIAACNRLGCVFSSLSAACLQTARWFRLALLVVKGPRRTREVVGCCPVLPCSLRLDARATQLIAASRWRPIAGASNNCSGTWGNCPLGGVHPALAHRRSLLGGMSPLAPCQWLLGGPQGSEAGT